MENTTEALEYFKNIDDFHQRRLEVQGLLEKFKHLTGWAKENIVTYQDIDANSLVVHVRDEYSKKIEVYIFTYNSAMSWSVQTKKYYDEIRQKNQQIMYDNRSPIKGISVTKPIISDKI